MKADSSSLEATGADMPEDKEHEKRDVAEEHNASEQVSALLRAISAAAKAGRKEAIDTLRKAGLRPASSAETTPTKESQAARPEGVEQTALEVRYPVKKTARAQRQSTPDSRRAQARWTVGYRNFHAMPTSNSMAPGIVPQIPFQSHPALHMSQHCPSSAVPANMLPQAAPLAPAPLASIQLTGMNVVEMPPEYRRRYRASSSDEDEQIVPANTVESASALSMPIMTEALISAKTYQKRRKSTPLQTALLEQLYRRNHLPTSAEREALAQKAQMTERAVQIWFQNRRQVEKRRLSGLSHGGDHSTDGRRATDNKAAAGSSAQKPEPASLKRSNSSYASLPKTLPPKTAFQKSRSFNLSTSAFGSANLLAQSPPKSPERKVKKEENLDGRASSDQALPIPSCTRVPLARSQSQNSFRPVQMRAMPRQPVDRDILKKGAVSRDDLFSASQGFDQNNKENIPPSLSAMEKATAMRRSLSALPSSRQSPRLDGLCELERTPRDAKLDSAAHAKRFQTFASPASVTQSPREARHERERTAPSSPHRTQANAAPALVTTGPTATRPRTNSAENEAAAVLMGLCSMR